LNDAITKIIADLGRAADATQADIAAIPVLEAEPKTPQEREAARLLDERRHQVAKAHQVALRGFRTEVEKLTKAEMRRALKLRYDPGDDAEKERSADLADAELMSRLQLPPGRLLAEIEDYLLAENPRGAKRRLDALRLMGERVPEQLARRVDDALIEAIPHLREARDIERAAHAAARQYAIAEAACDSRVERSLGRMSDSAVASVHAKTLAWQHSKATGEPYRDPIANDGDLVVARRAARDANTIG
jgi:hypothetical protein